MLKQSRTPVSSSLKLVKATEDEEPADQCVYQSAVGILLYLSTRTRPDIAFTVSNVAKFCSNPTKSHWLAVKRIIRYLKVTTHLGLLYTKSDLKECVGYSDADVTLMITSQLQDSYTILVEQLSVGEARSKAVWHCQQLRQNTWP